MRLILLVCILNGASSDPGIQSSPVATDKVAVWLKNGRRLMGEVDARTNQQRLCLRSKAPSIVFLSSIEWEKVASVRSGQETLSTAEFRAIVDTLKTKLPREFFSEQLPEETEMANPSNDSPPAAGHQNQPASPQSVPSTAGPFQRVRSLRLEVSADNWDEDVALDGLRVRVHPLAASGTEVAVDGTLEVYLIGYRARWSGSEQAFPLLDQWSGTVQSTDFGQDGAEYRFRFQKSNPEFDFDLSSFGVVHAKLRVIGQGEFEASESTVRIRTAGELRDSLQQQQGKRFFSIERTGGNR